MAIGKPVFNGFGEDIKEEIRNYMQECIKRRNE